MAARQNKPQASTACIARRRPRAEQPRLHGVLSSPQEKAAQRRQADRRTGTFSTTSTSHPPVIHRSVPDRTRGRPRRAASARRRRAWFPPGVRACVGTQGRCGACSESRSPGWSLWLQPACQCHAFQEPPFSAWDSARQTRTRAITGRVPGTSLCPFDHFFDSAQPIPQRGAWRPPRLLLEQSSTAHGSHAAQVCASSGGACGKNVCQRQRERFSLARGTHSHHSGQRARAGCRGPWPRALRVSLARDELLPPRQRPRERGRGRRRGGSGGRCLARRRDRMRRTKEVRRAAPTRLQTTAWPARDAPRWHQCRPIATSARHVPRIGRCGAAAHAPVPWPQDAAGAPRCSTPSTHPPPLGASKSGTQWVRSGACTPRRRAVSAPARPRRAAPPKLPESPSAFVWARPPPQTRALFGCARQGGATGCVIWGLYPPPRPTEKETPRAAVRRPPLAQDVPLVASLFSSPDGTRPPPLPPRARRAGHGQAAVAATARAAGRPLRVPQRLAARPQAQHRLRGGEVPKRGRYAARPASSTGDQAAPPATPRLGRLVAQRATRPS